MRARRTSCFRSFGGYPHPRSRIRRQVSPHARQLRRDRTVAEERFWTAVRDRRLGGYKFRFQHSVLPYVADFACVEAMLVVELDGSQHGPEADAGRQAFLEANGYLVLRFWNNEVMRDLAAVLEAVLAACERRSVR